MVCTGPCEKNPVGRALRLYATYFSVERHSVVVMPPLPGCRRQSRSSMCKRSFRVESTSFAHINFLLRDFLTTL